MRLFLTFFRIYPQQTSLMLLALMLSSIAEGISLSALLPLLSIAMKQASSDGQEASDMEGSEAGMDLESMVHAVFDAVGITPSIGILLFVVVLGITAKNILLLLAHIQIGYTASRVATDLRLKLLHAVLGSRWEYFLHLPAGRMANAMTSEAIRAADAYVNGTTMIARLFETTVYISIALLVSWQATIVALVSSTVVVLASHFLVNISRRAGERQTRLLTSLISRLTDTLQSVKPLKAMAREELADVVMRSETVKLNRALQKGVFSKALLSAIQEILFVALIALGIYLVLVYWEMPLPKVLMLVLLLGRIMGQVGRVQRWYQKMVNNESAYWSIQTATEEAQQAVEVTSGTLPPTLESSISLANVDFAYDTKTVLNNVSITIPKGSLTTFIGHSGAGKTTIIDMITGLLKPQHGEVCLDNVPLTQIDLRQWRRKIGYVPQENLLLHDSVLNNVTLGDPELGEADAEYALHAAGAWDFVQELAEGMHSTVGERGTKLSGGQRQRIMIARALAHRPELLILDEATSALDPKSEAAICETLQQLRGDLTILAISHQAALVDAADRVYRLRKEVGVILERPGQGNTSL